MTETVPELFFNPLEPGYIEDPYPHLAELRSQAATDANLMHPILECGRARATVGEMVESLQQVFGTYTETPVY